MTKDKPCPVCGTNDWYIDYYRTADGESRVDRCSECDWPPNAPHSVEEWREKWQASNRESSAE